MAEAVMQLFDDLHSDGSTICMVTHDPRSAERAKRQIEMFDGQIVADTKINNSKQPKNISAHEVALA